MLPIELLPWFVNQRFPSGPVVMPTGLSIPVPVKLETVPVVVISPMELLLKLQNQSAPLGPAAIPYGASIPVPVWLVIVPAPDATAVPAARPTRRTGRATNTAVEAAKRRNIGPV